MSITLISLAAVVIPAWLIQPFKSQTPGALNISYELDVWSPTITLLAIAFALLVAFSLWRGTHRWWVRVGLCIVFLPLLLAAWFARQNHFEWMFKPLPNANYVLANEASFVADADMVLAIELNGDAVAYPVRQIAYHHVVHDVVGGIPVVVTY